MEKNMELEALSHAPKSRKAGLLLTLLLFPLLTGLITFPLSIGYIKLVIGELTNYLLHVMIILSVGLSLFVMFLLSFIPKKKELGASFLYWLRVRPTAKDISRFKQMRKSELQTELRQRDEDLKSYLKHNNARKSALDDDRVHYLKINTERRLEIEKELMNLHVVQ